MTEHDQARHRRIVTSVTDLARRRNGDEPGDGQPPVVAHQELEADLRRTVVSVLVSETERRASEGKTPMTRLDRRRLAEATIQRALQDHFNAVTARGGSTLTLEEEHRIASNVLAGVFSRLPALEELLARPEYTDLFFNGAHDARARTVDGQELRLEPIFSSDEEMVAFVADVARKGGRLGSGEDLFEVSDNPGGVLEQEFTSTSPVVDLRLLPSGARFSAVGPWVTTNGTHISIRKHPLIDADQDKLVSLAMYDAGLASLLGAAVRLGWRLLIAGAPSAGKTTLLRALAHELDPDIRIVQIEQNPELSLDADAERHNQVLAWIERPSNMEGKGAHTLADHSREAQRHYPDRVIVGEVRGAEVMGMLKALSVGVPGMCTMHATSSMNVFSRLVMYAQEANQALEPEYVLRTTAESLDLVVYLRKPSDGRRAVSEVLRVGDYDETLKRPVTDQWFVPGVDGTATRNPNSPIPAADVEALTAHGYDPSRHPDHGGAW